MRNPFEAAPVTIRADLQCAIGRAWSQLGEPGAWLTGTQRAAVAAETRNAWDCSVCHERKAALSAYAVSGEHEHLSALPRAWVDVIHRVTTDSGRLTQRWVDEAREAGVVEDMFVEIISVSIITITIDAFTSGIGMDITNLPAVQPGAPPRSHYQAATPGPGWISTTTPENAGPELTDLYAGEKHFNIKRTLTLVPDEAVRFWALMDRLYLEDPRVNELDAVDRDISRAQIEFLAARCSALLGCYY
jgi:hypothetical protein